MSQGLIQNIFIFILCCPSSILGKLTQYMCSQYCLCTTNKQLHITKATRWTDKQSTKDFDVHGTLCYTYVIRIISIFLLKHAFFFLGTALMSLTACCHKHFLVFLCPLSLLCFRAHSNGSIRRGFKTDTSEAVTMRSGLGVNLKDVTVFNRGREKGKGFDVLACLIFLIAICLLCTYGFYL